MSSYFCLDSESVFLWLRTVRNFHSLERVQSEHFVGPRKPGGV